MLVWAGGVHAATRDSSGEYSRGHARHSGAKQANSSDAHTKNGRQDEADRTRLFPGLILLARSERVALIECFLNVASYIIEPTIVLALVQTSKRPTKRPTI